MGKIDIIAFDADDTLWHNERLYVEAQTRFAQLLAHCHNREWIQARLNETESRNIAHFGYGIKAFALSMIETSIELTEGRITGQDIQELITLAKSMINADVELLPHVHETVAAVAEKYPLMVITKGDLLDQESKIARSGLSSYFKYVEVVSQKTPERYAQLLRKNAIAPERFLMIGNAIRSDILPVLELGSYAVYVPYETTWLHEVADLPIGQPRFHQLEHLGQLLALLSQIEQL